MWGSGIVTSPLPRPSCFDVFVTTQRFVLAKTLHEWHQTVCTRLAARRAGLLGAGAPPFQSLCPAHSPGGGNRPQVVRPRPTPSTVPMGRVLHAVAVHTPCSRAKCADVSRIWNGRRDLGVPGPPGSAFTSSRHGTPDGRSRPESLPPSSASVDMRRKTVASFASPWFRGEGGRLSSWSLAAPFSPLLTARSQPGPVFRVLFYALTRAPLTCWTMTAWLLCSRQVCPRDCGSSFNFLSTVPFVVQKLLLVR